MGLLLSAEHACLLLWPGPSYHLICHQSLQTFGCFPSPVPETPFKSCLLILGPHLNPVSLDLAHLHIPPFLATQKSQGTCRLEVESQRAPIWSPHSSIWYLPLNSNPWATADPACACHKRIHPSLSPLFQSVEMWFL